MSFLDVLIIPVIFVALFIMLGAVSYEADSFKTTFQPMNQSMNASSQAIYNKYMDINDYQLHLWDLVIVGIIGFMIYASFVMASFVYTHPAYFPVVFLLGGITIILWGAINDGLDYIINYSIIGTYMNPTDFPWFYVIKSNMRIIIVIMLAILTYGLFNKSADSKTI